jgi:flavin-binding protein dodecin
MDDHVYKLITVVGTSSTTIEDAVQNALTKASATVRNMRWFQVTETRGAVENDKVGQWQVTIQVGFRLD